MPSWATRSETAEGGQGEQNPLGRTTRTNFDEKLGDADLEGKDAAGGANVVI